MPQQNTFKDIGYRVERSDLLNLDICCCCKLCSTICKIPGFLLTNLSRYRFDKLSKSVAAKKKIPMDSFKPPVADFFPDYPIHTLDSTYKADLKKDAEEDDHCNKAFESSSTISGGLGTITCGHKITKGFRLIQKGESPQLFLHSLLRRFPSDVKAKKRVIIYDFACKMHKCALVRFPYKIRRFQFVIDRHHQANHTACSEA